MADHPTHPAAARMIDTIGRHARAGSGPAFAALYAYESQQPEVSRTKIEGLQSHYRVESERALAYFRVHAALDLEHREGEPLALGQCPDAGARGDDIIDAASSTLDAYWALLDGVLAEAGIGTGCDV